MLTCWDRMLVFGTTPFIPEFISLAKFILFVPAVVRIFFRQSKR
jgi:hypothetical protein